MKRSAGYTLVEVLIMLAVTAILSATVLETVRASVSNGLRIERASRTTAQEYITLASVRRAIEASRTQYRDQPGVSEGDEFSFSALTSRPVSGPGLGLQSYELRIQNAEDGATLLYQDANGAIPAAFWPNSQARLLYLTSSEPAIGFANTVSAPLEQVWVPRWPSDLRVGERAANTYFAPIPLALQIEVKHSDGSTEALVFHLASEAAPRARTQDFIGRLPQ